MTRAVPAPLAACAAWACACSTPTPKIVLDLAGPPTQACPDDCAMITLPCDPVMSIRIVEPGADPKDTKARYLDECVPVLTDTHNTSCALASVGLDSTPLPVRDLAVQIAVFPGSVARDKTGALICPPVYYDGNGFPMELPSAPSLGRQVFYHPGDATVDVKLGCTDVPKMQAGDTCNNPGAGAATATVLGFDSQVPVPVGPDGTDGLFVWSGEPRDFDRSSVLQPPDVVPMQLDDSGTVHWTAERAQSFQRYACVEVLEDVTQTAATLHCSSAIASVGELTGYWMRRDTLQSILKTAAAAGVLADSVVPDIGLTIGLVVDGSAVGVAGVPVTASDPQAHITYLSKTGIGSGATFATGIFVSTDAAFGTTFSAPRAGSGIGGLVAGKATIVVLTMGGPTH
jgi:hypothetical protein